MEPRATTSDACERLAEARQRRIEADRSGRILGGLQHAERHGHYDPVC